MSAVSPAGGRHSTPLLAAERGLPAAFIGDAAALCIASWSCTSDIKPLGASNACCSQPVAAAAAACGAAVSGTLFLAGIGSQLLVYDLPSGRLLCCQTVLPDAARLHGISWMPGPPDASGQPSVLVAVHGGRHAALLRLLCPAAQIASTGDRGSRAGWQLQLLKQLRFVEWTMEVQLAASSGCSAQMAVGLSSNAVQLFAVHCSSGGGSGGSASALRYAVQQLGQVECSDRSLLYSMALLPQGHHHPQQLQQQQQQQLEGGSGGSSGGSSQSEDSWLVAAGTILHDVLVWAVPAPASSSPAPAAAAPGGGSSVPQALVAPSARRAVVAPLFRLRGHMGSVHRCGGRLSFACRLQRSCLLPLNMCMFPRHGRGVLARCRVLQGSSAGASCTSAGGFKASGTKL